MRVGCIVCSATLSHLIGIHILDTFSSNLHRIASHLNSNAGSQTRIHWSAEKDKRWNVCKLSRKPFPYSHVWPEVFYCIWIWIFRLTLSNTPPKYCHLYAWLSSYILNVSTLQTIHGDRVFFLLSLLSEKLCNVATERVFRKVTLYRTAAVFMSKSHLNFLQNFFGCYERLIFYINASKVIVFFNWLSVQSCS